MKRNNARPNEPTGAPPPALRQRAEERLRSTVTDRHRMSTGDMQRLVHELQVTQIELQLQNEDLRQTQIDLEQARDCYRELYDYAPVGYVTLTREGVILEANLTTAKLFREARASLIGTLFSRFLAPESRDIFYDHLRQVALATQAVACEVAVSLPNDRRLLLQLESAAVSDQQGSQIQCRTVLVDVTARKQAENALRQQAEIIDQVHDAVIATDLTGLVTSWNKGAERMFGYTAAEMLGHSVISLIPEALRFHVPQTVQHVHEHGQHALEIRVSHKSGQEFDIYIAVSLRRDEQGTPIGLIGYATDITARKRAEDWMYSLIASTQDAVISIDRHACIVLFNPSAEKIFGYSAAEVVGEKVNVLMAEPYAHEHDEYIARYERTHERRAIGRIRAVTGKRKSGETFPMELSVTEIHTDRDMHYAAFIRDISEKVRLQEKAVEHERLATIGITAAKLGHEIGNPLNSMTLSLQLLERRLVSLTNDDKVVERVRGLRDQIARLTQLLQEFRNLSRRQDYRLVPTNLSELVTEVLTAETENYATRGVTIVHERATELPLVKADTDKLRQVLLNLCKNAVEAMPDGGTLTVQVQQDGANRVQLHIRDTGNGIPDGVNIFEPFITTKPEGTGLGLPVVRQIVAAHGGELTYHTALGQGTTFTVSLVAVDEDTQSLTDTSSSFSRTGEGR